MSMLNGVCVKVQSLGVCVCETELGRMWTGRARWSSGTVLVIMFVSEDVGVEW